MGGSPPPPPAPTIVMPTPTAPRLYRTIVPQESYQDVVDFGKRLDEQILALQKDRETEVGTSAELAERMRGRELQERASYLASLPGQFKDPGIMDVGRDSEGRPTSKGSSMMNMQQGSDEAKKAALTNVDQAKKALQKATSQRDQKSASLVDPSKFDPEYAKRNNDIFKVILPDEDEES